MAIFAEWFDNETCDNCKRENQPHCAKVSFNFEPDKPEPSPIGAFEIMLCSDCVEGLKKRLS